jgi:hypothetical protein
MVWNSSLLILASWRSMPTCKLRVAYGELFIPYLCFMLLFLLIITTDQHTQHQTPQSLELGASA